MTNEFGNEEEARITASSILSTLKKAHTIFKNATRSLAPSRSRPYRLFSLFLFEKIAVAREEHRNPVLRDATICALRLFSLRHRAHPSLALTNSFSFLLRLLLLLCVFFFTIFEIHIRRQGRDISNRFASRDDKGARELRARKIREVESAASGEKIYRTERVDRDSD